jgi:hypothetical protein
MRVFFTYIYGRGETYTFGGCANTGWPLTFSNSAARSMARNILSDGDLVFGVISSSPGHGAVVPEDQKGRVVSVWQVTRQNSLLTDYDIELSDYDLQWPYALQPIRTWEIAEPPKFKSLDGYDADTHTLRSVSSVEYVNEELAQSLLTVFKEQATEVALANFKYATMQQRNETLRQKHPVRIDGYTVPPADRDALNFVYVATLGKGSKTLKIGHAVNPDERVDSFNKYRLTSEPQWVIEVRQAMGTVQNAVRAEAALGEVFATHRTEANNNEVYLGLSATDVLAKLATMT